MTVYQTQDKQKRHATPSDSTRHKPQPAQRAAHHRLGKVLQRYGIDPTREHNDNTSRGNPRQQQHRAILQMQRLRGNKAVRRSLKRDVVQRGLFDFLSADEAPKTEDEQALEDLKKELRRAQEACDSMTSGLFPKAKRMDVRKHLKQAGENFGKAADAIEKGQNLAQHAEDITNFGLAVNRFAASDPSKDQAEFAAAADALFTAAGTMGEKLPEGPWTTYFTFLTHTGNFFSNMYEVMDNATSRRGNPSEANELDQYIPY